MDCVFGVVAKNSSVYSLMSFCGFYSFAFYLGLWSVLIEFLWKMSRLDFCMWMVQVFEHHCHKTLSAGFPGGSRDKGNPPARAGEAVWSLVREDPTCHGVPEPVRPAASLCSGPTVLQLLKPEHPGPCAHLAREAPTMRSRHTAAGE